VLTRTPPELAPPQHSRPSGPAAPELRWERFHAIAHELPTLFTEHRRELWLYPDVPLDPDWDKYYALDIAGTLRILTVRVDGALVGYLFGLFGPHLHSARTMHSGVDMLWLDPLYRQGWTGFKLFKEFLRASKEWGVVVANIHVRTGFADGRVGKLLLRLGFTPIEVNYSRKV